MHAFVDDGTSLLRIEFEGFEAGDRLAFSIDVDEVEDYDPTETDVQVINDGFDPITSGVEFQGSSFVAGFSATNFEDLVVRTEFLNRYDPLLEGTDLQLPADDEAANRDRTAGAVAEGLQVVIPANAERPRVSRRQSERPHGPGRGRVGRRNDPSHADRDRD